MNDVVARAVALVRYEAGLRRIALHVETSELPPLLCDPGQTQQVVLVLLMNAIEAMEAGSDLRVATLPAEGEARIVVEAAGGGIPADVMPRIFEAFCTTKDEKLRTGLGLAVALSIVEQHGGTIQVESAAGQGARFTVALPWRGVQTQAGAA